MRTQIFQVVCVVKNLDETLNNWKQLVDFRTDSIKDVSENTNNAECIYHGRKIIVRVKAVRFDFGGIDLKLVQPLNDAGDPYSDALRTHGQGFHHLGIYTENGAMPTEKCSQPVYEEISEAGRYLLFDYTKQIGFAFAPSDHMVGPCAERDAQGHTI